jgi:hypothetical protein
MGLAGQSLVHHFVAHVLCTFKQLTEISEVLLKLLNRVPYSVKIKLNEFYSRHHLSACTSPCGKYYTSLSDSEIVNRRHIVSRLVGSKRKRSESLKAERLHKWGDHHFRPK